MSTEAKVVLSVVDHITAPLAAIQRRIDRLTAPVRRITRALGDVGRAAGLDRISNAVGRIGSRISAASAHAATFLGRLSAISGISFAGVAAGLKSLWGANAQIEGFRSRLDLLYPGRQKEAEAFVQKQAATSPGNLADTFGTFARLRGFGFNPLEDGSMQAVTNYNALLGGTQEKLDRISLAVGQMRSKGKIQGDEMLQLTEAGVPAMELLSRATGKTAAKLEELRKKGKLGTDFIMKFLAQMQKESAGAADHYAKTAVGIVDKLQSAIYAFKVKIGDAGSFAFLKEKLDQFADWVNSLPADQVAKRISDGIIAAGKEIEAAIRGVDLSKVLDQFQRGWEFVKQIGAALKWLSDLAGGPVQAALIALGVFTFAPLLASITSVILAIPTLIAALATPVGAFLLAVGVIAGAAALIYQNWEPIKKLFDDIWTKLSTAPEFQAWESVNSSLYEAGVGFVDSLSNGIQSRFPNLVAMFRAQLAFLTGWLPDWAKNSLGLSDIGRSGPTGGAGGSWDMPSAPAMPGRSVAPAAPSAGPWGSSQPSAGVANSRVASAFAGAPAASGVPVVGAQPPQVSVDAPMSVSAEFNWASADPVIAQIRAALENFRAQSEARIRAAAAAALAD